MKYHFILNKQSSCWGDKPRECGGVAKYYPICHPKEIEWVADTFRGMITDAIMREGHTVKWNRWNSCDGVGKASKEAWKVFNKLEITICKLIASNIKKQFGETKWIKLN